jgi:hypothetical protein
MHHCIINAKLRSKVVLDHGGGHWVLVPATAATKASPSSRSAAWSLAVRGTTTSSVCRRPSFLGKTVMSASKAGSGAAGRASSIACCGEGAQHYGVEVGRPVETVSSSESGDRLHGAGRARGATRRRPATSARDLRRFLVATPAMDGNRQSLRLWHSLPQLMQRGGEVHLALTWCLLPQLKHLPTRWAGTCLEHLGGVCLRQRWL